MKKTITLIALLATPILNAAAQGETAQGETAQGEVLRREVAVTDNVTVRDLRIGIVGGEVVFSFTMEVGREAVGRNSTAQIMPVIEMDGGEIRLPGIVVEGRGAALSRKRRWVELDVPEGTVFTVNGGMVEYSATVPLDSVRVGSGLKLEVSTDGGSVRTKGDAIVLAGKFMGEGRITIPPVYRTVPHSEGDLLSQKYTFVAPLSEFEEQNTTDRDEFVDESRGNSLTVYFRTGATAIDPGLRGNAGALERLADAIGSLREAEEAGSSKISHIIVAGYSSPEGDLSKNRHLAYERAAALRDYLAVQTGIDPEKIDIHNGGVDWAGLRLQVEHSDMGEKDEVVALMGNVSDMTEKEEEALYAKLRGLNGGRTYNRLSTDIFPEMRVATFLRIYYENIGAE